MRSKFLIYERPYQSLRNVYRHRSFCSLTLAQLYCCCKNGYIQNIVVGWKCKMAYCSISILSCTEIMHVHTALMLLISSAVAWKGIMKIVKILLKCDLKLLVGELFNHYCKITNYLQPVPTAHYNTLVKLFCQMPTTFNCLSIINSNWQSWMSMVLCFRCVQNKFALRCPTPASQSSCQSKRHMGSCVGVHNINIHKDRNDSWNTTCCDVFGILGWAELS